jgi:hypothetical protein
MPPILRTCIRVDYDPIKQKFRLYHMFTGTHSPYMFSDKQVAILTAKQYMFYILGIKCCEIGDWLVPWPIPDDGQYPTKLIRLFSFESTNLEDTDIEIGDLFQDEGVQELAQLIQEELLPHQNFSPDSNNLQSESETDS